MPDNIHDMSRAVGALEAQVENLIRTWGEQDRKATEGRRELYSRFETLSTEFTKLAGRFDSLVKEVAKMAPSVRLFEDGQQRTRGAQNLGKTLWAIIVAAAAAIGWAISEYFKSGAPPHH